MSLSVLCFASEAVFTFHSSAALYAFGMDNTDLNLLKVHRIFQRLCAFFAICGVAAIIIGKFKLHDSIVPTNVHGWLGWVALLGLGFQVNFYSLSQPIIVCFSDHFRKLHMFPISTTQPG
jgi:hypothetical protein